MVQVELYHVPPGQPGGTERVVSRVPGECLESAQGQVGPYHRRSPFAARHRTKLQRLTATDRQGLARL